MSEDKDLFFWIGNDGAATPVSRQGFDTMRSIAADNERRWKEVDTSRKSYYFYGIIEETEDDEQDDTFEANDYDSDSERRFDELFRED